MAKGHGDGLDGLPEAIAAGEFFARGVMLKAGDDLDPAAGLVGELL